MESARILIVEDNPAIRKAIESILAREGYDVSSAFDGKQALDFLEIEIPDLIISDIMMPNINGYELYKNLRDIPRLNTVPFIFLTALNEEGDVRTGKELGVDDYITKPFKREDILSTVKGKLKRMMQIKENTTREIENLKKDIIMTLSHEFKTPLTIINGFTSLLLKDDIGLNENQLREFLKYIKVGGDRLGDLINDFIYMMEIDSGVLEKEVAILRAKNDINSLLCSIVEKYSGEASKKSIDLTCKMESNLPLLTFSVKHISIAFEKIIDNAFKFLDKDKGFVKVRSFRQDGRILIEFEDNGEGIPENEIPNIFKKFYQIQRRKREQPGTGLGLSIARSYIEINKGSIGVKSEQGTGSTFFVEFLTEE